MESCYSAKYLAEKLSLSHFGSDTNRIEQTLFNAKISLHPHQIQAALFAFANPMSKGVMLCDEVGLGKTIEAGIIISQFWCERKRHIIVISPASLTRQWQNELEEKFNLPSVIIDRKYYNHKKRQGYVNPFYTNEGILIMSMNFASKMADEIRLAKLDLAIIDEAHKLRNVYNPSNIMANRIKYAVEPFKKVLLTATPLQNNLMELYGLAMLLDDSSFGDKNYYRQHYVKNYSDNKQELRDRLSKIIHRTLRKNVQKYVKYPKRLTETFTFVPSVEEDLLYDTLTKFIQSNPTFGVKNGQNTLIAMILRKLLSSSTAAVISTLEGIKNRLVGILEGSFDESDMSGFDVDELDDEFWEETDDDNSDKDISLEQIETELEQIDQCLKIAYSINDDKKAYRLLDSIDFLFSHLGKSRQKKILIFTESRKTQDYLYEFLITHGHPNVVLFNGGASDQKTKDIYNNWAAKPENAVYANNSKATNIRTAVLEYFRDHAEIMISTEAGAEGLNIQFCSMMVNYDLPWNPQRVEQRIGRCHRFGQKNDVLVINFLNEKNVVDARVYELLSIKFRLFDDVFGSSDEVLGKLDSESNFEREIFAIYQSCRTPEEINKAFDDLQSKYKDDISKEMEKTRALLIDNFDEDLQDIFDAIMEDTTIRLKALEMDFLRLCVYTFGNNASFVSNGFDLSRAIVGVRPGKYIIASPQKENVNLRLDDRNGEAIIEHCKNATLGGAIQFDLSNYPYQIKELELLRHKKCILSVGKVSIESFETEEHLILTALTEDGDFIDKETCEKLFRLSSYEVSDRAFDASIVRKNRDNLNTQQEAVINESMNRNNRLLQEEIARVDQWANDKIAGIQLKVESLREERKELQRRADYSVNATEKIQLETEITRISRQIKSLWLDLADSEDEVERLRSDIIKKLRAENMKKVSQEIFYDVVFEVV